MINTDQLNPESGKKILAVIGMAGSGKTEVIKYLEQKYKWPKVYFPEVMFDEMKRQNLEPTQENERLTRERMRAEKGMGVMAELSLLKIQEALKNSQVVLAESLYSWDEYKIMKQTFGDAFKTVAVYAAPAIRFLRLKNRPVRPLKTYEEFQKRDWTEIEGTAKGGPIAIADYTIINETTLDFLHGNLEEIIKKEGMIFSYTMQNMVDEVVADLEGEKVEISI